MRTLLVLFVAVMAATPASLAAQGSLGAQGFGYPTGQLGTGALGSGGSTAEIDPASPINPAAMATARRFSVYMQFEPEFRRTSGNGTSDRSTTMRFPGFMGTGSIRRLTAGVSFSTLLDRTWSNTYSDSQVVGGETFPSSLRAASNGAISDARFAAAYFVNSALQVGAGVHAISGENRLEFGRAFGDSSGLGSVGRTSLLNYSGRAVSVGVTSQPLPGLLLAASARLGGTLRAERDGTPIASGEVPSRYGVGATWIGIPNTTLSARYDRTAWSDMRDMLGSGLDNTSTVFDATEIGLGVEVAGPAVFGVPSIVRLGARDRTLPFGANGEQVAERAYSGGVGIPLARGRAHIDLTLQRALRNAAGVNERSWFVGVGLGIRP